MTVDLNNFTLLAGTIVGLGTLIFTIYKYFDNKKIERQRRDFEAYHQLISLLVDREAGKSHIKQDRQIAAIYELRFYKRYTPLTKRILKGLQHEWSTATKQYPRLDEEIGHTLNYLDKA